MLTNELQHVYEPVQISSFFIVATPHARCLMKADGSLCVSGLSFMSAINVEK